MTLAAGPASLESIGTLEAKPARSGVSSAYRYLRYPRYLFARLPYENMLNDYDALDFVSLSTS